MKKEVLLLGSTGSIGTQTVDVLKLHADRFSVIGLSCKSDVETLYAQAQALNPKYAAAEVPLDADRLPAGTEIFCGPDAAERLAEAADADVTVLAISGYAALRPLLAAIRHGKRIAIANKESLVCGGSLVDAALAFYGAELLPIDSEQSAIFQALQNGGRDEVERLILTASGGPFFRKTREELRHVSLDDALCHPTWKMGRKITLDSATLMNKGLEIIEASRLFHFDAEHISVLIHPQSIVHSMVEYRDGTIMANLSKPDMRLPIQYALTYPLRTESPCEPLKLDLTHPLEFYPADPDRFHAIRMAYDALRADGIMPTVFNGANERAAEAYFAGRIGFIEIEDCVDAALNAIENRPADSLEAIAAADRAARYAVDRYIAKNKR
ncbi:MAG: 1-deoxy-D-xylulose-5-phosphate reductoisomerase [Clostridia bacterium]|nr:1-deoxy-D-xylulose-5-phosphate reductoisomerase [Clostridia bacterium]